MLLRNKTINSGLRIKTNNIAIIGNTLLKGGAEKQSIMLCRLLSEQYNTVLIVLDGRCVEAEYKEYLDKNNCKYFFLTGNMLNKIYLFSRILIENRITVTISFLLKGNLFSGVIGQTMGIKQICGGIRSSVLDKKKLFIQRLLHKYFHTYTITNNQSSLEYLSKNKFDLSRVIYIPNIIENQYSISPSEAEQKFNVLTVCRFDESKDLLTSLKAFEIFLNSTGLKENIIYSIVGYGEYEQHLREWISKRKLDKYVILNINPRDVNLFYKKASLYLSTSKKEGLSNSILEAMSYSLPIIATKTGDNDKLIKHGMNGYLAEIGNKEEIASYIKMIYEDPEMRKSFGKKSIRILSENYCEDIILKKYSSLFN